MLQEQKFHLDQKEAQFLDRYREYGFKDKNELVKAALQRLQLELESRELPDSAELNAETVPEDGQLPALTESGLEESSTVDVRELSGMLYQADRKVVSLEEMEAAIAKGAGESI